MINSELLVTHQLLVLLDFLEDLVVLDHLKSAMHLVTECLCKPAQLELLYNFLTLVPPWSLIT